MSERDDDILARELGKVGELAGKFGARLGGSEDVKGAGVAASLGAQFAAKFLPTETYKQKLALKIGPEKAIKLGFSVLTKLGRLEAEENKSPYPLLKAVVGSGILNMNSTIVWLEILAADSTGCEVTVTAAAKEGLIKQRTAAKAGQRVVAALKEMAQD